MSKRSKSYNRWNRGKHKEETPINWGWHHGFNGCLYEWDDIFDWDYDSWYDDDRAYHRPGYVSNMGEYHQMKVLTLLRKLSLREAKGITDDRGW